MTDQEIEALPGGVALDEQVARKLLGYSRSNGLWLRPGMSVWKPGVPAFSTDPAKAWEVADVVGIDEDGKRWRAFRFKVLQLNSDSPDTVARNICVAALLTIK